ncbi:MAG: M55 family metallopeptidase [Lentisphaeria bacterium]|nr:M55 family metallopeptidase [Lentisphaeria bacterium]
MKIYIFADMEGISGIANSTFVLADGSQYAVGRKYLTREVNICAQACFDAGADEVVVRDGHGGGVSILWSEVIPGVKLIQGATPGRRFFDIEGSDGIILLGYHAMAGTQRALLEHTYSSKSIQNIWMNGVRAGEFAIDTAIAGEYGVPVIMTSGCDKLCAEARAFLPQVVTCCVKRSISCQSAMLLAPADAEQLLRKRTAAAIARLKDGKMKPYINPETVTIRTEYIERCEPAFGLVADRTVERSGTSVEKVFLGL